MKLFKIWLLHDIKNLINEKKSICLISFINIIIFAIAGAFSIGIKNGNSDILNLGFEIQNISNSIISVYSLLLYTTFPLILGIVIISYLKEFGELELMMLFPINRKLFFIEKVVSVFLISLFFAWGNFSICLLIQKLILKQKFLMDSQVFIFMFVIVPFWLFFISCLTIFISSTSKNSKDANQKSMLLPFVLLTFIQLTILLKINIFSQNFLLLIFGISIFGILFFLFVLKKKFCIEKILYK